MMLRDIKVDAENDDQRSLLEMISPGSDPGFVRIARLAVAAMDARIAMITLDQNQHRRPIVILGLDPNADPVPAFALVEPVMAGDQVLLLGDARKDKRLRSHPWVINKPFLRFVAAAPIRAADGLAIGALVIADGRPREVTGDTAETMLDLADIVVEHMDLRHSELRTRQQLLTQQRVEALLKQRELELERRQELLNQTERVAKVGGWAYDIATGSLLWSDEVFRLHDLDEDQLPTFDQVVNFYAAEAQSTMRAAMDQAVTVGIPWDLELPFITAKGRSLWVRTIGQPEIDDSGVTGLFGVFQDISERKRAEQRIHHLAHHDSLTGLPNRTLFLERLNSALACCSQGEIGALLLIDLDHFKSVNDTLGHDAGDALLRTVGRRLKQCVRQGDTVARLGGDEFAILLRRLQHYSDAEKVAAKIVSSLTEPVTYRNELIQSGTSIGITVFPRDDRDASQLLKNADIALYKAKGKGRGMFCFFIEKMKAQIEDRKTLETQLRQAIADQAFELYYQPRFQLAEFKLAGFEALLRWRHPVNGLLAPAVFLSVAEESGLIVPIGEIVVRMALQQARAWSDAKVEFGRIAINLAAAQFKRGAIVDLITKGLSENGLSPSCLEIEVTEGLLVGRSTDLVAGALRQMHRMGLSIVLDDFGTGFASLSHLKAFPIDSLKIDQSFVHDIETDREDASIVRAVITLGQSLGKNVIAEGIETADQLEFLKSHGCQEGQGFLFAPPLPPDEAVKKVRALRLQS